MRILIAVLLVLFLILQYRLWVGKGSLAEVNGLKQEIGRLEQDIQRTEGKLANPAFVDKAPEAVVQKERDKLTQARAALAEEFSRTTTPRSSSCTWSRSPTRSRSR